MNSWEFYWKIASQISGFVFYVNIVKASRLNTKFEAMSNLQYYFN